MITIRAILRATVSLIGVWMIINAMNPIRRTVDSLLILWQTNPWSISIRALDSAPAALVQMAAALVLIRWSLDLSLFLWPGADGLDIGIDSDIDSLREPIQEDGCILVGAYFLWISISSLLGFFAYVIFDPSGISWRWMDSVGRIQLALQLIAALWLILRPGSVSRVLAQIGRQPTKHRRI